MLELSGEARNEISASRSFILLSCHDGAKNKGKKAHKQKKKQQQ